MGGLGNVPTCLDQRQTTRWCPSLVVYGRCCHQWVRILSILRPGLHPHVVLTAGRDHPSVTPGVLTDIWTCAYSTQSYPLLGPGAATGSLRAASSRVKHCPPDTDIWDCPPALDGEAVGTASANLSCDLSQHRPEVGAERRLLQALLSASLGPGGGLPWRLWATGAKPQSLVAGELAEDTAPEGGLQAGGSVQVLHRQQSGGFHRSCPPGAEVRLHRLAA